MKMNSFLMVLNYLGEFNSSEDSSSSEKTVYTTGSSIAAENRGTCSISINGSVSNGVLGFVILFEREKYTMSGMEAFAKHYCDALVEIGSYCSGADESIVTASDFSDMLDTEDFDSIIDLL